MQAQLQAQPQHKASNTRSAELPAPQNTGGKQRLASTELTVLSLAPRGKKVDRAAVAYEFSGIAG